MSKYVCLAAAVALSTFGAFAQNASSKATAAINTAVYCTMSSQSNNISGVTIPLSYQDVFSGAAITATPDNFVPIMAASIKVSNSQSLFATPSLVTGLYTNTAVKSSPGGGKSTATAEGGVYLRAVLRDPTTNHVVMIADPIAACTNDILGCQANASGDWGVTLDARVQTLSQELSSCGVTIAGVTAGTCSFDLTTQLILQTTSAHSFGFIFPNVGVGTYVVSVEAAVNSDATLSGSGAAVGAAAFGLGSLTVESVRLVHNFSF
jgi:hypothetical protein